MKYHIYGYVGETSKGFCDYERLGEFKPAADLNNCWFYDLQLWTPENGFKLGTFKVANHWIISDDRHQQMMAEQSDKE